MTFYLPIIHDFHLKSQTKHKLRIKFNPKMDLG